MGPSFPDLHKFVRAQFSSGMEEAVTLFATVENKFEFPFQNFWLRSLRMRLDSKFWRLSKVPSENSPGHVCAFSSRSEEFAFQRFYRAHLSVLSLTWQGCMASFERSVSISACPQPDTSQAKKSTTNFRQDHLNSSWESRVGGASCASSNVFCLMGNKPEAGLTALDCSPRFTIQFYAPACGSIMRYRRGVERNCEQARS